MPNLLFLNLRGGNSKFGKNRFPHCIIRVYFLELNYWMEKGRWMIQLMSDMDLIFLNMNIQEHDVGGGSYYCMWISFSEAKASDKLCTGSSPPQYL